MITVTTGVPTATSSPPCVLHVADGLDKERKRKMGLELGGDNGRIDLHEEEEEEEEEGNEDEDAGDIGQIEPWLEEQCSWSMLGLGLDHESEVGLHHRDDDECAGGGGRGSFGFGIGHGGVGVGGTDGGPSRAGPSLFGFGWHWDSPETESLAAPPPSVGLLSENAIEADASAPSAAYLSGVPSLSMSLSSTPSSSFMTVSSTAEVVVHSAHVKNNSTSSNQVYSLTKTTATMTPTPTAVLDGTAKWGRSRLLQQQRQNQQQPMPTSPLPFSSPLARCQSRAPSVSVVSSSSAVVPPLSLSLPSLSSPSPQPPYAQQYYHPNESSSPDGNHQQQTQGRGLSLTTRLRSMSSLGNWHIPPPPAPPASSSAVVVSAGSPPLSALSSALPTASPSTPIVPGNNKENVSGGRESGGKCGGGGSGGGRGGGALSTLLLWIQKAPKRNLVIKGVAMEDVDAYEAIKRWCEVGCLLFFVELRVNAGVFSFQGFGQVRNISRASSGCLYVDFKKASVAETVCHVSLIFPFFWFRFCVLSFGFFFLWFWFRFWLYGVVGR
jgi:hypothetical protein